MLMKNLFCFKNLQNVGNWRQFQRTIWGYVAIAFNQVDMNRLKEVGPDRLCAEWILKNGGGVRFKELPNRLISDYNVLPPESTKIHVKEVDASNSSIMKIGLEHFQGCNDIDTVIFHSCKHLENDSLAGLKYLAKTLKFLQVSSCYNINDDGLKIIGDLKLNLNFLTLFDMRYVKNIDAVAKELKTKLPNCNIEIADK